MPKLRSTFDEFTWSMRRQYSTMWPLDLISRLTLRVHEKNLFGQSISTFANASIFASTTNVRWWKSDKLQTQWIFLNKEAISEASTLERLTLASIPSHMKRLTGQLDEGAQRLDRAIFRSGNIFIVEEIAKHQRMHTICIRLMSVNKRPNIAYAHNQFVVVVFQRTMHAHRQQKLHKCENLKCFTRTTNFVCVPRRRCSRWNVSDLPRVRLCTKREKKHTKNDSVEYFDFEVRHTHTNTLINSHSHIHKLTLTYSTSHLHIQQAMENYLSHVNNKVDPRCDMLKNVPLHPNANKYSHNKISRKQVQLTLSLSHSILFFHAHTHIWMERASIWAEHPLTHVLTRHGSNSFGIRCVLLQWEMSEWVIRLLPLTILDLQWECDKYRVNAFRLNERQYYTELVNGIPTTIHRYRQKQRACWKDKRHKSIILDLVFHESLVSLEAIYDKACIPIEKTFH